MLTLGFAFMASLLFESPFIGLEKLIFGRKPRSKPNVPNSEVRTCRVYVLMGELYVFLNYYSQLCQSMIFILSLKNLDDFSGYFVL